MKKLTSLTLFIISSLACRAQINPINNLVIQHSGTALSGIPKMNGTSAVTTATPGTDYGNVSTSGSPTSGQTAEFSSATAITGVANTGTGSYVKATSPTIATPAISSAAFTGATNTFNFGSATPFLSSADWGGTSLVGISGDDAGSNNGQFIISSWVGNSSNVTLLSSGGTSSSPAASSSGDTFGDIAFAGNTTSPVAVAYGADIAGVATENWSPTANGSEITFSTTPNGTTTQVLAATIGQDKSLSVVGPISASNSFITIQGSSVALGGSTLSVTSSPQFASLGLGSVAPNTGDIIDFRQPTTGIGTISVTASSGTVTGSGTSFFSTFRTGQTITANSETHTITGVSSNTSLTTDAWTNSASSQSYTLVGGTKAILTGSGEIMLGVSSANIGNPIGNTGFFVARTQSDVGQTNGNIYTYYTGDILSQTRAAFTGQLVGFASTPQIGGSNSQDWTQTALGGGLIGGWFSPSFGATGGSGNITTATAIYGRLHIGTANNLTNGYGLWIEKFTNSGATWTNSAGVAIDDQNAATNNTDLLVGTVVAPSGNYAIYSASAYPSSVAGKIISGSSIQPVVTTVSGLPSSSPAGQTAMVTDASTTVILGLGLVVTGGGANFSPVYSDGTNWRQY